MTQLERLHFMNRILLSEAPQYNYFSERFADNENEQFLLFRSLVNLRPPKDISEEFLGIQNDYLSLEIKKKGITELSSLAPVCDDIYLWQGDITTLRCDAIVNAANSQLLGCFCPCHACIDNAIHTFSGVQLRNKCNRIMIKQGCDEKTGKAKITPAYNLPSKYVIHTVGPIVNGKLTEKDCRLLESCYLSCLEIAEKNSIESIAFCCISTGEFHFPNERAAKIAVDTVKKYKEGNNSRIKVIFNVFKSEDYDIYRNIFRAD